MNKLDFTSANMFKMIRNLSGTVFPVHTFLIAVIKSSNRTISFSLAYNNYTFGELGVGGLQTFSCSCKNILNNFLYPYPKTEKYHRIQSCKCIFEKNIYKQPLFDNDVRLL